MKFVAILNLYFILAQTWKHNEISGEWEQYKITFNKSYTGEEDASRLSIYMKNIRKIAMHNDKFSDGLVSYKAGINQFTDMREEEVKATMNGFKGVVKKFGVLYDHKGKVAAVAVDWRNKGAVTPVKNQGHCGSCWSFSATGTLEGQHFLHTGNLVSLSEQNLVDCSTENFGCQGGWPFKALLYIKENNGIDTEKTYSYTAEEGDCKFNEENVGATDTGYVDITQGSEEALKTAVSEIGPISVAIDASHKSFHSYSSGVYNEPYCSSTELDHAVLVVGYGTENGQDYWLVKNSWGTTWGESGYIKMSRNKDNQCGIATQACYPTV